MLLRLAYLAVTNTLTFIRLLPMGEREKNIEIPALRHQLAVLQRVPFGYSSPLVRLRIGTH